MRNKKCRGTSLSSCTTSRFYLKIIRIYDRKKSEVPRTVLSRTANCSTNPIFNMPVLFSSSSPIAARCIPPHRRVLLALLLTGEYCSEALRQKERLHQTEMEEQLQHVLEHDHQKRQQFRQLFREYRADPDPGKQPVPDWLLCCNKVKRFPCSGSMNHVGIRLGGKEGWEGGGRGVFHCTGQPDLTPPDLT